MQLSEFDFELPESLIAQTPLAERGASRLLRVDPVQAAVGDFVFADLPGFLNAGDLLVFNDTRVIPARLFGRKATGGRIEVMVERVLGRQQLLAHLRSSKAPKSANCRSLSTPCCGSTSNRRDAQRSASGACAIRSAGRSKSKSLSCMRAPVVKSGV